MDAVQQANSGHPGTPMAMAPVAYALWARDMATAVSGGGPETLFVGETARPSDNKTHGYKQTTDYNKSITRA